MEDCKLYQKKEMVEMMNNNNIFDCELEKM